jgi:hypothetical protein
LRVNPVSSIGVNTKGQASTTQRISRAAI